MIYEVIISTMNEDGSSHVAPMGVSQKDDFVVLKPFKPSKTLENIITKKMAVMNIITDVRVFAGAVTGRLNFNLVALPGGKGFFLKDALSYLTLSLAEIHDDELRSTLYMTKVNVTHLSSFKGFNRAQAAIIEASVLMSRLDLLSQDKIKQEIKYLKIAISKTAGRKEIQAWEWLMEKYENYCKESKKKIKLLVSIRSIEEVKVVDGLNIDIIDLKEPKNGPIGMLDYIDIKKIVLALRDNNFCGKISTTFELNDGPLSRNDIAKIEDLGSVGLDYIKVGVSADGNNWANLTKFTESLSQIKNRVLESKLILVLMITDKHSFKFVKNISPRLVRKFSGIMIDTLDKESGSVFDVANFAELSTVKKFALENKIDFGIAGSLDISHTSLINQLQPNWAGYRGGVCLKKRSGPLSRVRLENLIDSFS
ncbi:DUF447 family protein [Betaproteobacteria bacterium]|nr:DUF447 family protein [Betaproteobacteria bacterium]